MDDSPSLETGMDERPAPVRSVLGFLLIILALGPFYIYRASLMSSFWADEIFSILVSTRTFKYMIGITTFDAHPPGFYVILYGWLKLGRMLGIEGSVFWARLPGLITWVALVGIGWWGGRYLLGRQGGTLYAWALASNGQVAYCSHEIRNYILAITALTLCMTILFVTNRMQERGTLSRLRAVAFWFVYLLAAALALWLHLLSTLVLFFMGLLWIVMVAGKRPFWNPLLVCGFLAQAVAAISFIPWLITLRYQLEYLSETPTPWMTATTFGNWLGIFIFHFPFGRIAAGEYLEWNSFLIACSVFLLVPLVAACVARLIMPRLRDSDIGYLSAGALFVSVYFTSALWLITEFGIAKVFHAPRYPSLAIGFFVFAISGAAVYTVRRLGVPFYWAWLLMLPWFAGTFEAQRTAARLEAFDGFHTYMVDRPEDGSTLYVIPSLLTDYLRPYLNEYHLLPGEDVLTLDDSIRDVDILEMRWWTHIHSAKDRQILAIAGVGNLSDEVEELLIDSSLPGEIYGIHRLRGLKTEMLERMRLGPAERIPELADAVSFALPEEQLKRDGFDTLEFILNGDSFIWGAKETVSIRFNTPVPAGDYTLSVSILRQPYPEDEVEMEFAFDGQEKAYTELVGEGSRTISIPIRIGTDLQEPTLRVTHPTWKPKEFIEGSNDPRNLSFYFTAAWLTKVGAVP